MSIVNSIRARRQLKMRQQVFQEKIRENKGYTTFIASDLGQNHLQATYLPIENYLNLFITGTGNSGLSYL